jgi:hypothetical protein
MKYFTLLGGILGFTLTFVTSLSGGADAGLALRDAMFGCLVGAALFRGFRRVMVHHARQVLEAKARATETTATAQNA